MTASTEAPLNPTKRHRTPVVLQSDMTECGAACLRIILAYHGCWVDMSELREAGGVGRDGITAADIVRAARKYGLNAQGWRRSLSDLHKSTLPAILYWEFNHFVVLEGIGKDRYYVNNPESGHMTVAKDAFDSSFTGISLEFNKASHFQTAKAPPGAVWLLWSWLREFRPSLALTVLLGLMLALTTLAVPLLLTVVVDHVLIRGQTSWSVAMVLAMAALTAITYALTWLQLKALRKLSISIAITQSDRFLTHLFRLPVQFFAHRLAGDLLIRAQLINAIATGGAGKLVGLAIQVAMCLAFLAAMIAYNATLAFMVLLLGAICGLAVRLIARLRTDFNHVHKREQGNFVGLVMAGTRTMASIRATATEDSYFARWGGFQANEINARQRYEELGHLVDALPGLFLMLGSALVLGFGGWQVILGNMTVGALMGYYVLADNFLRPIGRLIVFTNEIQAMSADLRRLDEILRTKVSEKTGIDETGTDGRISTLNGRLKLTGLITMKNVTFGYQRGRPPLIKDFNLTVQPGERVAIVGHTGSGKTSLALLLAGIYRPWSGEILYDGHPLEDIPLEVFTESLGMVDQQPMLFGASIRDNLTFWNPTVPDELILKATHDAAIHDEILSRPGGYDSLVYEEGGNFSGGQRQRLEIARSLVKDPSILILDEATSSLDAVTEVQIDRALRRRGCTCLIIAHRLSTIRDSDLIIALQNGKEVHRGRHEDLIAKSDLYRRLVDAE